MRWHTILLLLFASAKMHAQGSADTTQQTALKWLDEPPAACLGFWEDEEGHWRLEIQKEYFGVNDQLWTYDTILLQNGIYHLSIKDAKGAKKAFTLSDFTTDQMTVGDPYLMTDYRARRKEMDEDFKKMEATDLPVTYIGKWVSVDSRKVPIEVRRNGVLFNGLLWEYHQILWVAGQYRITLQRAGQYHLWIPYWIFEDQLTGVFNPVIPMEPVVEVGTTALPDQAASVRTEPRKIGIDNMPSHFFGNWSNRNGDWMFQIRKEFFGTGQRVWEYGSLSQEDDLYILEAVNWFNARQGVEIKKFTFRFITDYWMEVTENGNYYEVFSMPFTENLYLLHSDELPEALLQEWYHSSGQDSLRLGLQAEHIHWAGKAYTVEQILKRNDGYQFTGRAEDQLRLFQFDLLEDGFLQVSTNGKVQLFNRRPTPPAVGTIISIALLSLSVLGLGAWLLLRWRTKIIQRAEARKRRQLELEVKALRSQMNPHFLFNSLNAIQNLVNKQDTDRANHYLSRFSRLMRKVLNNSESAFISLEEEIALLQSYCELEALRFNFSFDIQVDPDLDMYITEIPSMLIQPFVENAILHGIEPSEKPGRLLIKFQAENSLLRCTIEDNGIGINRSRALSEARPHQKKHFGMRLAEERLMMIKAHYGQDLKIRTLDKSTLTEPDTGTRIDIYLPSNVELANT